MNPIYLLRLSALAERKEFVVHILVCARNLSCGHVNHYEKNKFEAYYHAHFNITFRIYHTCGNLVIRSSYFKRLEIKVSKVCPGGNVM